MDKISIYELLSYIIPGYILIFLFNYTFELDLNITVKEGLQTNVLVFVCSLIIGIILHSIVENWKLSKWFSDYIYKHPSEIITKNDFVKEYPKILKQLETEYKTSSDFDLKYRETYPTYLFDYAYLYLEAKDKIAPVKNLHSIYFMLRNLNFISIFFALVYIFSWLKSQDNEDFHKFLAIFICIAATWYAASYIRKKYVTKCILNFYVHRIYSKIDKN